MDQLRLETAAADRIPAREVLPLTKQLHETNMQRVLDTMDERLHPELIYQPRDGRFDSPYSFCHPFVTEQRHVDLVGQWTGIGGQTRLFLLEILILLFVVNHRPC